MQKENQFSLETPFPPKNPETVSDGFFTKFELEPASEKSQPSHLELEPSPSHQLTHSSIHLGKGGHVNVPKRPLRIRISLEGEELEGDIFIVHAPDQTQESALVQFLDDFGGGFFPLREVSGTTEFIRANNVQWFALRPGIAAETMQNARKVRLGFGYNSFLEGEIQIDALSIAPRLSDLLNEERRYLILHKGDEIFMVRRDSVIRAYDLGAV